MGVQMLHLQPIKTRHLLGNAVEKNDEEEWGSISRASLVAPKIPDACIWCSSDTLRSGVSEMWKLKVAEGENDPYLYSTNDFVGRQIWEFDPDAGTPEERAEVEAARARFYKNRFKVKQNSDLLWRMQFLNEKNFVQKIQQVKVGDDEEITFDTASAAVKRAVNFFSALQARDGHWPAENGGPLFFLPPLEATVERRRRRRLNDVGGDG
ncbi:hypothetical protein QQ045_009454 [Rhodiola kirilowii]